MCGMSGDADLETKGPKLRVQLVGRSLGAEDGSLAAAGGCGVDSGGRDAEGLARGAAERIPSADNGIGTQPSATTGSRCPLPRANSAPLLSP